jgi:hypothetical protein
MKIQIEVNYIILHLSHRDSCKLFEKLKEIHFNKVQLKDNSISLVFTSSKKLLKFSVCDLDKKVFTLSNNDYKRINKFISAYCKDGIAECDHIDIEFINTAKQNQVVDLMISVDDYKIYSEDYFLKNFDKL